MIGKLIKHEFLATSSFLFPAYAGAIIFALLNRWMLVPTDLETGGVFDAALHSLLALLYTVSVFTVLLLTVAQIVRRFYSNVLGVEGYVTHTLPLTLDGLIFGKLIPASAWTLVGLLVIGVSAQIMPPGSGVVEFFPFDLELLFTFFRHEGIILVLSIATGIATLCMTILSIYSALTIGHLMRKGRLLWAILIFMGMGFGLSSLFMTVLTIVSQIGPITHILAEGGTAAETVAFTTVLIGTVLQVIAHYAITRGLLRHRLNLP